MDTNFKHGITVQYFKDMLIKCNNDLELQDISKRVDKVFDVSFNYDLIKLPEFKRLYSKWIDMQSDKYLSFQKETS